MAVADARRKLREIESKTKAREQDRGAGGASSTPDATASAAASRTEQDWRPRVGDSVFVPSIQSHAVVEKITGDKLTLRKGMLTMTKVGIDQVQKPQ